MVIKTTPGRHKLRVLLLVCLLPWSGMPPPLCDNVIARISLTASTGPQTRPGDTSGADLHASDGDQSATEQHTSDQTVMLIIP
jgi:hypothetical protein